MTQASEEVTRNQALEALKTIVDYCLQHSAFPVDISNALERVEEHIYAVGEE